jgi:hypothetical protein
MGIIMEQTKTCRDCGEDKPLSQYYKHKLLKDGHYTHCKICANTYNKQYYEKHKEKLIQYRVEYNRTHERKHYRDIDSRIRQLLKSAASRKQVDITKEEAKEIWNKQNGICAYSKLPLTAKANQFNTVSLDRIDSSKHYTKDNVQFVCAAVNRMKQEYAEEIFVLLCHLITQNNKLSEPPEILLARFTEGGTLQYNAPNSRSL